MNVLSCWFLITIFMDMSGQELRAFKIMQNSCWQSLKRCIVLSTNINYDSVLVASQMTRYTTNSTTTLGILHLKQHSCPLKLLLLPVGKLLPSCGCSWILSLEAGLTLLFNWDLQFRIC